MRRTAFDSETTGLEPGSRPVSIGAIIFDDYDGLVIDKREMLINPQMPIPEDVQKVHGITDADVASAPNARDALADIFDWIGKNDATNLIIHNAAYDTNVIGWEAARHGLVVPSSLMVTCTMELAKAIGEPKRVGLSAVIERYGLLREGLAHTALSDADICRQYFMVAKERFPEHVSAAPCVPWAVVASKHAYGEPPSPLWCLPECVAEGRVMNILYVDKDGERTERSVTPYGWASLNGEWYFHGWCHLRNDRRSFRFDRVEAIL